MVKRIILLGDSFTFGHGCSDKVHYYDQKTKQHVGEKMSPKFETTISEYCWGSLLQKQFSNIEVLNIAKPGHCFLGMFRDLLYLSQSINLTSDDLVLLNGTFIDRTEIAHPCEPDNYVSWTIGPPTPIELINNEPEYLSAKKMYTTYLHNDTVSQNQFLASFLGIHDICNLYDAKFAYSLPKNVRLMGKLIDRFNSLKYPYIFEYDFSGNNDDTFNNTCYMPDLHCNNLGHEIYLQKVVLPFLIKKGFLQ
jgi:hypothetical protein